MISLKGNKGKLLLIPVDAYVIGTLDNYICCRLLTHDEEAIMGSSEGGNSEKYIVDCSESRWIKIYCW